LVAALVNAMNGIARSTADASSILWIAIITSDFA
jgi:hypothetical protein